jgi:hypothetical protein
MRCPYFTGCPHFAGLLFTGFTVVYFGGRNHFRVHGKRISQCFNDHNNFAQFICSVNEFYDRGKELVGIKENNITLDVCAHTFSIYC